MRRYIFIRSTRDAVGTAVAIVLAVLAITMAATALAEVFAAPAQAAATCQEDEPCWTWSTMGNRHRGIVTLSGNARVVGPCTFQRLYRTGHIAYSVAVGGKRYSGLLERMRGDVWAIAHGCDHA
jgi:hypothetical protein